MRKFFGALLMSTVLFFTMLAAPANAWDTTVRCNDYSRGVLSDGHVCMEVSWRYQNDGSGLIIDYVRLYAMPQGAFEPEGLMVDGEYLSISNGKLWEQGPGACNVNQSGNHTYSFSDFLFMPRNSAWVY